MSDQFELSNLPRSVWDELAGGNFYSTASWLDFCATEHAASVEAAVVVSNGTAEVAVPLFGGADLVGSPYDWNAQLAKRSLPTLAAGGYLVGPREGYQTQILRANAQPSPGAVAQLLAEIRTRVADKACVAMYMSTEDVRLFRAAGATAVPVLLECDAWLPVPDGGFDAWFAGLSKKRKYSVRHEIDAFTAAGYEIKHIPLRECAAAIAPLAVITEAKYGYVATVEEDLASLGNHERCLGEAAMVALCLLDKDPVGFCLYYVWQDTIFVRWVGFDYPRLRGAFEYFNLMYYEQLRWAAQQGVRWIHTGLKATKAKALRGAVIRPLWLLDLGVSSPLVGTEQAVHDHNAAFLGQVRADSALAGAIADPADWLSETQS
jgi:hypothetical protein